MMISLHCPLCGDMLEGKRCRRGHWVTYDETITEDLDTGIVRVKIKGRGILR